MPEVTMGHCRKAVERVKVRWGHEIPEGLKKFRADDIFRIVDSEAAFVPIFEMAYKNSFMKAFGKSASDLKDCCSGAGGFCSPEEKNEDRRIYIPKFVDSEGNARAGFTEFDAEGLVSHEYLHWLSHPNFFPRYFTDGHSVQVEGATEWLRMKCYKEDMDGFDLDDQCDVPANWAWYPITPQRSHMCAYASEYESMNSWLKSAKKTNLRLMLDFVFKGIPCSFGA